MGKIPKLPDINWKLFITMILIIVITAGLVKFIPKLIPENDKGVGYVTLDKGQIPEKIHKILPKYKMLERALAVKADDKIYVIVTRGQKLTAGYDVDIEKLELVEKEEKTKLIVYAMFKDPGPDDIVTQSITHPYAVIKTELKELPNKIDLAIEQKE